MENADMCGIIGVVGKQPALPLLTEGLRRLSYRGYDSAGVATLDGGKIARRRAPGAVENLEALLREGPLPGSVGIGHTRWATHGAPTMENAHPHFSWDEQIALVHNGIIENAGTIRKQLRTDGVRCVSDTDSEVVAHLIRHALDRTGSLSRATAQALQRLKGQYAFAVMSACEPDTIVAARRSIPLYIGIGEEGSFIASDIYALAGLAVATCPLKDGEVAILHGSCSPTLLAKELKEDRFRPLNIQTETTELGGYPHHLLREIHEQPEALKQALAGRITKSGRVVLPELESVMEALGNTNRIILCACGTSYYAAMAGARLIEQIARIPAQAVIASEWRQAEPVIREGDLCIALTQSGETADTKGALLLARSGGATTLSVTNRLGSEISTLADANIHIRAGHEVSVASTKAYTAQVVVTGLVACLLAQLRRDNELVPWQTALHIRDAPHHAEAALRCEADMRHAAETVAPASHVVLVGRGFGLVAALEGALKLYEVSYVPATAYPAGEFKHGPLAGIEASTPVVIVAPNTCADHSKLLSNIQEIKARGGRRIIVGTRGDDDCAALAQRFVALPPVPTALVSAMYAIPLQLLAYYTGVERGCSIDKPRNLAKSVTVE